MTLKLEIRRNTDGVVATDFWPDWNWGNDFWWSEGNMACDCNRELAFLRARNEVLPEVSSCSEGRYSVRCTDAETGAILYDELTYDEKDNNAVR